MSNLLFSNAASAPSTPSGSKTTVWVDVDGRPRAINSGGIDQALTGAPRHNYLRNAGFWFAQRQTPGTLTTYSNVGGRAISADGWGISNENASAQFRRVDSSGSPESGLTSRFYGELTKITSAGKLQFMQAIEGSDALQLRGRNVRLSFLLKSIVAASADWNIALVELTSAGTLDTIPITAGTFFTAQGADGVDPTLGTNLDWIAPTSAKQGDSCTAATNGYLAPVTTTWQRFGGVFTVPSDCKNLVVVIFSHNDVAATNGIAIAEAMLTSGETIHEWDCPPLSAELARVQRYHAKTFELETAPAQNAGVATGCLRCILGKAGATALAAQFQWRFPVPMRAAPTVTTFNPAAANAEVRQIGGTAGDLTATASANATQNSVDLTATGIATGAVGDQCGVHVSADAEL